MKKAYIQLGNSNELPMKTIEVDCKENVTARMASIPFFTKSGYGAKIPTSYMVHYANKWRRVYCKIYSNIGTEYCFINGKKQIVNIGY